MKYFLVFYEYGADYMEKRGDLRDPHMAHLKEAAKSGGLQFGGACMDNEPLALVMFKGENKEAAEDFARNDPYVTSGLAKRWYVREYFMVDRETLLRG